MIHFKKHFQVLILTIFIFGTFACSLSNTKPTPDTEKKYYGIKINNVVCGYSEFTERIIEKDGKKLKQVDQKVFMMLTLLGSKFNTDINILSYIDPETAQCYYNSLDAKQGDTSRSIKTVVKDNIATITTSMGGEPVIIKMTPDIIFGDRLLMKYLKKDFADGNTNEKTYNILDPSDGKVRKSTFTKLGTEKIKLPGKTYDTVILNQVFPETGLKMKFWYNCDFNDMIKLEVSNRIIFKADRKIVDKIKVADMNPDIFTKANVSIADIQSISYMKLKAQIEPTGVNLTPESLNVPGQTFTGTVKGNVIDGIFEIEHKKYTGENAPPFPADYTGNASLKKYLEPAQMIESNDPVLIEKAGKITSGAKDSWEAACRLSKWVAENISYAIPGGITARKTYDMKAGECGAHSCLLAAFCRAVGIPSRVVWGAMYAPNYGGGFGQHAWSEIYMGDAGWITVDTTAFEEDYVDSGHIRIAELQSMVTAFNGKKIEILDYKAGSMKMGQQPDASVPQVLEKYLGSYTDSSGGRTFNVIVKDGSLVVDVKKKTGNIALPFNMPDKNGLWFCKFAKQLFIEFQEDDQGKVTRLDFHQIIKVSKKSEPETAEKQVDKKVPEKFKPYLGKYYLAAANLTLKVFFLDETLAVDDPQTKNPVKLHHTGKGHKWIDQYDKNTITFKFDDKGNVTGFEIDSTDKFTRKY